MKEVLLYDLILDKCAQQRLCLQKPYLKPSFFIIFPTLGASPSLAKLLDEGEGFVERDDLRSYSVQHVAVRIDAKYKCCANYCALRAMIFDKACNV